MDCVLTAVKLMCSYPELIDRIILIAPASSAQSIIEAQLSSLKRPVLILWADNDPTIPIANAQSFVSAFGMGQSSSATPSTVHSKSRFYIFKNLRSHIPEFERPAEFASVINEFYDITTPTTAATAATAAKK